MSPQEPEPLPLPAPASSGARLPLGARGPARPPQPHGRAPRVFLHGKSHWPRLGNPVPSVGCWIPHGALNRPPLPRPWGAGTGLDGDVAGGTWAATSPSPSTSPTAQPPVPLGPGFTHPLGCAGDPGVPVPTASPCYHVPVSGAGAQHGGCSSPQRPPAVAPRSHRHPQPHQPPTVSSRGPQGPKGPGEAGPRGWDGADVRPQGHPHPVTFPRAGESHRETNLQLQLGKLRHGRARPWGLNRGVRAAAGSRSPTPPPRPTAAPP